MTQIRKRKTINLRQILETIEHQEYSGKESVFDLAGQWKRRNSLERQRCGRDLMNENVSSIRGWFSFIIFRPFPCHNSQPYKPPPPPRDPIVSKIRRRHSSLKTGVFFFFEGADSHSFSLCVEWYPDLFSVPF